MSNETQYVTFGIANEIFALPVASVQEILEPSSVARLPLAPDYLLGLMDVRGAGVPIVDLRVRLGLPPLAADEHTRVIVVETPDGSCPTVGLVADRVFEVTALDGDNREVPPAVGSKWRSDCISGVGRRGEGFVIILKLREMIDADEMNLSGLQQDVAA